ncbi:hypothetical protein ACFLU6_16555, partial [Acidobacteriota bacterium]
PACRICIRVLRLGASHGGKEDKVMKKPEDQQTNRVVLFLVILILISAGSWTSAQGPIGLEKSQTVPSPLCPGDTVTYGIHVENLVFGPVDVEQFLDVMMHECFVSFEVTPGLPGDTSCMHQPDPANSIDGQVCFEGYTMNGGELLIFDIMAVLRDDVPPSTVCPNQAEVITNMGNSMSQLLEAHVQDCSPDMPDAITGLLLTRQGYDVHMEYWDPDSNAVSYSVYMVVSEPLNKIMITDANAYGMALFPNDIERLCREVSLPPPACVHPGGVSASPACIYYQVVGVAFNGMEGPN